ncbi:hypothetical protein TNCV_3426221 [Trichonephila clavipes]|nr:hypothetical protein TNCV_3426221 [Trichonephila clavipes]
MWKHSRQYCSLSYTADHNAVYPLGACGGCSGARRDPEEPGSATVPVNRNRSIHAKRNHFPLKPACSLTIHKSQGGTFDEIAYKYRKAHSQLLVYEILSKVMT